MYVGFREVCTNFVLEFVINIILYKDREIDVRCQRMTEKVSDEKISNRTLKKNKEQRHNVWRKCPRSSEEVASGRRSRRIFT